MTKIDIISGFLGAGKTTLIKKLIEEAFQGQKLVLIENEFGEIGIDGGFLKDAGIQITEMNSGCICCSLVGDFTAALEQVIETYHPDRIMIEPSGVGKLSDVVGAVLRVGDKEDITINSMVTVADATKCKMYMKNFGEFYNDQIETASTIILSRTQTMKQDRLEKAVSLIQEKNKKGAQIITTPWDQLTGTQILQVIEKSSNLEQELLKELEEHRHEEHHHEHHHHEDHEHHDHHDHEEECSCGCHHHHHADEVFTSWGKETPAKYSKEELADILHKLSEETEYGMILRAKGMLPTQDGEWMYFDLVPGEYEIRTGSPDYTGRICVIGSQLQEEKLMELFHLA
ncbi:MAG TPA: GTP-binding protein [Candidatus Fimimorpha faecalis]|uniref:GTP-binding protein n=1 Tax=Candidatus Fimimorpha faecalis TaxID=2840824 RepID=A0A9D1ECR1_9FIRM|nr:GTP-binding protein [Candidatus Fimimorpha faecalis]